jgi:hypothetical protein
LFIGSMGYLINASKSSNVYYYRVFVNAMKSFYICYRECQFKIEGQNDCEIYTISKTFTTAFNIVFKQNYYKLGVWVF